VDAQTESLPEELTFDEQERLFINYGYLNDELTPLKTKDPALFSQKAVSDIFRHYLLTDFIAECWSSIRDKSLLTPVCSYSYRENAERLFEELKKALDQHSEELLRLLRHASLPQSELEGLVRDMDENIITALKVAMRVKEYREGKDADRQAMSQCRFRYYEAERVMNIQLSIAQKVPEEPIGLPEAEEFLSLHERTKIIAKKYIYLLQEEEKAIRQKARIAKACSQFSDLMTRRELRNMISKKREYLVVPSKVARMDSSPLCGVNDMEPFSVSAVSERMSFYSQLDMDMFTAPRIRMYGVPRVILVPGQGWGSYDWNDHSLLIPAFPTNDKEKAVTYALGSFRWDSDEDRLIKNSYETIKDNVGKSILEMAASFYKDYFIWMTKEKLGYRVLPRNTFKAFEIMFSPRKEEN
jgi:hypothetical protein